MRSAICSAALVWLVGIGVLHADTVKIGLNYPKTGPYAVMGLDQWQATEMAVDEINTAGGILEKQVEIVWRDSQSKVDVSTNNAIELIDKENVRMVFGGSASSVAIAVGTVCQEKKIPFFGTLTYSTETTAEEGKRHVFRECYDAWMGAKALGAYLKQNHPNQKYFYIVADYTWGHTTEASMRNFTDTTDTETHRHVSTPFPGATDADFKKALSFAKMVKPDVLVLVLFGDDMVNCVRQATAMGMKSQMQIVVPNLTLGMAEGGGPKVMENVVGALPWCWNVPYKYDFPRGKKFVEDFASRYNRYPSTSGASAYTILYEYKNAVERAGSFDSEKVIQALEGHTYTLLKDPQTWRDFDHQSVQTVYLVRCKPEAEVLKDRFKLDYFEILDSMPGENAVRTREEWNHVRAEAGKPTELDPL
ncbi:MAG: substrate-binding protein [Pirellulales bacterium]|nr:substrate-binding protein [Pirellulales bacterium]